ncbi:unnamed protein product [Peniophora sp. CBMAI 1063]|nr:unnamed protein product [Peniophora sp. CBMAI 1063]
MPNNLPSSSATSRPRRSSLTDRNIDIMREHCDKVISTPINQEEAVEEAEPVRTNRQHWEEHVSDKIEGDSERTTGRGGEMTELVKQTWQKLSHWRKTNKIFY